jgi:hypothetical protein
MQPYLFPYAGYFQLVAAVDRFVFYDDVNYIKGGWINRNRLFLSREVSWLTFPLCDASPNGKINQVHVQPGPAWKRKLLASVRQSYSKAPFFEQAFALFADIVLTEETSLSVLARASVVNVARYLGLRTEFVVSTGRYGNEDLRGQDRVLDICRWEGASEYHNLPGGAGLYSGEAFFAAGVDLHFVEPRLIEYSQLQPPFKPGLSVLDVLMFNDRVAALRLLGGV